MTHAPMLALLDCLERSAVPATNIQSRQFPDDPRRTAYIVSAASYAEAQRAVTEIMASVEGGAGQADFVGPYKVRHGATVSWESKGVVERRSF